MHLRFAHLTAVLTALLAACTQPEKQTAAPETPVPAPTAEPAQPSDAAEPKPAADECGAGKLGQYRNQLPTGEAMAKVKAIVGHDRIRTINPGDAVTMVYRPDRLNIEIGSDGRIKQIRCG